MIEKSPDAILKQAGRADRTQDIHSRLGRYTHCDAGCCNLNVLRVEKFAPSG